MAVENNKLNYFYSCSNDILKRIAEVSKSAFLSRLSLEYSSFFESEDKVDDMWSLISTSLLMSENLFGTDNIYQTLDDDLVDKIEEVIKLALNGDWRDCYDSYFLNENNIKVNEFHRLIYFDDVVVVDDEEAYDYYKEFGCNSSVIDNNYLDYKKLVVRIRNAIAHSNYEVIDNNFLRIYHYKNDSTEMDLNIILNKTIVLTIIDEFNQRAFDLFDNFVFEYENKFNKLHFENRLVSDSEIVKYLLSFHAFDEDKCIEFLNEAKRDKKFYELSSCECNGEILFDNFGRFNIIYELICGKYMEVRDYAMALDALIFDKLNKDSGITGYLWDRISDYNYFNNNFNETTEKLEENKLKLLLVSFLNSIILYGFNYNDDGNNINYSVMDFSKMIVDEEFTNKEIRKKYNEVNNLMRELAKQEKNLVDLTEKVNKDRGLLLKGRREKIETEHFTIKLPQRIEERKSQYVTDYRSYIHDKKNIQYKIYKKLFEILDFTDVVNGDLSEFVFRHLRNSLAHGYIKFPNGIDINNIESTVICFEDYEKNQKDNLTFRGTIIVGELLQVLTNGNVMKEIFKNVSIKKKSH